MRRRARVGEKRSWPMGNDGYTEIRRQASFSPREKVAEGRMRGLAAITDPASRERDDSRNPAALTRPSATLSRGERGEPDSTARPQTSSLAFQLSSCLATSAGAVEPYDLNA